MFNRQSPLPLSNAVSTYTTAPYRRRKELDEKTLSLLSVCLVGAGLALVVSDGQSLLLSAITSIKTLS